MNLPDLTVVGPAFFEVFVPPPDARPVPGEERYVDRIPVGLGGALNAASVADSVDRAFLSHGDFDAMNRCPEIPLARWVHMGGIKEAFAVPLRVAAVRAAGARVCACACWSPDDLRRLAAATDRPLDLLAGAAPGRRGGHRGDRRRARGFRGVGR